MEDAAFGGLPQVYRHIEPPDCQILLHPVTNRPAHNAVVIQIEDNGEVEPVLCRPGIGDVTRPLLVGRRGNKIAVQSIGCGTQTAVAIGRNIVPASADLA